MVSKIPQEKHAVIQKLLAKVPSGFKELARMWNQSMANGDACYSRPIGIDTRRLYLNAANKFWKHLELDYSNLYAATIMALESCRPEQYSTKRHVKESAISLAKYLIHRSGGNIYGL